MADNQNRRDFLRTLAVAGITALAGCGYGQGNQEYGGTTRTVPVLSIKIQKGDNLGSILTEEIKNSNGNFDVMAGHNNFPNFTMYGDSFDSYILPKKGSRIMYEFSLSEIIELLNPDRFDREPIGYPNLRVGEFLSIPNFSGNGTIAGRQGNLEGHLVLQANHRLNTPRYSRRISGGGDPSVKKTVYFQPKK